MPLARPPNGTAGPALPSWHDTQTREGVLERSARRRAHTSLSAERAPVPSSTMGSFHSAASTAATSAVADKARAHLPPIAAPPTPAAVAAAIPAREARDGA